MIVIKQTELSKTIEVENKKYEMIPEQIKPIVDSISKIPLYLDKIKEIKQMMTQVDQRMQKMKTRTTNLVQKKKKDELANLKRMEKERERERLITAKPAKELLIEENNSSN